MPTEQPERHDNGAERGNDSAMRQMGPYLNLGMELFASVAGFGLLGWFIDDRAGTSPIWMLVLLMAGAVGGMYNFIRSALKRSGGGNSKSAKSAR